MILHVQTFILSKNSDDVFEGEFFINDERHEQRVRLARHCWWAMRNGRSVTTFAKENTA